MRSDIMPGGICPEYALPGRTGTVPRLSELHGWDPLILTLAGAHYCPKEHQHQTRRHRQRSPRHRQEQT